MNLQALIAYLKSLGAKPMPPTHRELLYGFALTALGTDASPYDKAPDELGCAESLTSLINKVNPNISWTNALATASVYKDMASGAHFVPVSQPLEGDIIISPTKFGVVGHCGILGRGEVIMSNNSFKDSSGIRGIFDENYTRASWRRLFVDRKGLNIYLFRLL